MNDFALAPVALPQEDDPRRSPAEFFDFLIDGESLRDRLRTPNVGVLSHRYPSAEFARHLVLDGSDPLLGGLAMVYGCRECLDTLCGGQAVKIDIEGDRVYWSEIQSYWIDLMVDDPLGELKLRSTTVGPFEFDLAQYRTVLEPFLT